jgi:hypothetical protein
LNISEKPKSSENESEKEESGEDEMSESEESESAEIEKISSHKIKKREVRSILQEEREFQNKNKRLQKKKELLQSILPSL